MTDSSRIGIELSEWAAQGDWRLIFLHRDAVKALDAARVKKVAQEFLKSSNRTVGLFIPTKAPERAPLPPQPDVVAMVKNYKGVETLAQGEAFAATIDEHREAHRAHHAAVGDEAGPPVEEDARQRGQDHAQAAHRQREGLEGSGRRHGAVARHGAARHQEAHLPAAARRARPPQGRAAHGPAGHRRRARPGDATFNGDDGAAERARGAGAARRDRARADLPEGRVREAEEGEAGAHRGQPAAAAGDRVHHAALEVAAVSQGRRALSPVAQGAPGAPQGGQAGAARRLAQEPLGRGRRRAGDGRRLRPGRGEEAGDGAVRHVEGTAAVQADGHALSRAHGVRRAHRRPRTSRWR